MCPEPGEGEIEDSGSCGPACLSLRGGPGARRGGTGSWRSEQQGGLGGSSVGGDRMGWLRLGSFVSNCDGTYSLSY